MTVFQSRSAGRVALFASVLIQAVLCPAMCCVTLQAQTTTFTAVPSSVARVTGTVFEPGDHQPIKLVTPSVSLITEAAPTRILLRVERRGKAQILELPEELVQVDEMYQVTDDKAVLLGMVNSSVSATVIIDLRSSEIADVFWCYRPSVSPNGEYLAFIKFYPAHFVADPQDHLMLYNLRQTALENRPQGTAITDKINVGVTLLPLNTPNVENDNLRRSGNRRQTVVGRLFWSPDSLLLVLAASSDDALNITWLVRRGDRSLHVESRKVQPGEVCATVEKGVCRAVLSSVHFRQGGFDAAFQGLIKTAANPVVSVPTGTKRAATN